MLSALWVIGHCCWLQALLLAVKLGEQLLAATFSQVRVGMVTARSVHHLEILGRHAARHRHVVNALYTWACLITGACLIIFLQGVVVCGARDECELLLALG